MLRDNHIKNTVWNMIITYWADTNLTNTEYFVDFTENPPKKTTEITLPEK